MIHELRVYRCAPGKLPELHKRFETVTLKLWEKHGALVANIANSSLAPTAYSKLK